VVDWSNRTGRIWLIVGAVIAVAVVVMVLLLYGGEGGSERAERAATELR